MAFGTEVERGAEPQSSRHKAEDHCDIGVRARVGAGMVRRVATSRRHLGYAIYLCKMTALLGE